VDLAATDFVAHAAGRVVDEPQCVVLEIELDSGRIAGAARKRLAAFAVERTEANNGPNTVLVVEVEFLARRHVEGLPEHNVELFVIANAARAHAVAGWSGGCGEELSLRHCLDDRDVRAPVEELHRGKGEDPIVFDNDEEPVR